MNKKHISKFPVGTLVEFKLPNMFGVPTVTIYGIVIGHTTQNVKVMLSEPYLGNRRVVTSTKRLKSVQRLHQKPKVQQT